MLQFWLWVETTVLHKNFSIFLNRATLPPSGSLERILPSLQTSISSFIGRFWWKLTFFKGGREGGGGGPFIINFYLNYYWWTYEIVMFQILSRSGNKWKILLLGRAKFFLGIPRGAEWLDFKRKKLKPPNFHPKINLCRKFHPNWTMGMGSKIRGRLGNVTPIHKFLSQLLLVNIWKCYV